MSAAHQTSNKATVRRLADAMNSGDAELVEKDMVTGTHQGEFNGLPPTGKSVSYNEIWGVVDIFSQMKQLGMIQT
jgi:predicted ester cyclase